MAKIAFTAPRVAGFKCPADKSQVFLWDSTAAGLALRATPAGKPAYVFQGRYEDKTIRITIGSPDSWSIPKAQEKARELQRQIDEGHDPRDIKRGVLAAATKKKAAAAAQGVTVGDVWPQYLAQGKPKRKDAWKPGYRADLEALAKPGGEKKKRGAGLTRPGTLYPLMALTLKEVSEDSLQSWFDLEAQTSKHQAARALMMFKGFLRWCAARPAYRGQIDRDAGRGAALAESMPQIKKRTDCLEDSQVSGWFAGVDKLANRTIAIYLKGLLMSGARREELAALKWADVDFKHNNITLADKVDETRVIPLTPYLAQQLALLPRTNEYVFSADSAVGHIIDPRASHARVMLDAGIKTLTTHGLRRSFSLLGEAAGAPAGAIAQVMGHKPSATAEGYRPRSVDALRPYLAKIEAYILDRAGVVFVADAMPGKLRVVN
jgi:integrase